MYPWLDLDLLNLQCTEEKTEAVTFEGNGRAYEASRYTAVLLSGKGAKQKRRLGLYTCVTVPSSKDRPLITEITFDLELDLPELPKIGVYAKIPAYYDRITWFGAGPHESYPDRCASAFLGLYEDTVSSLETPYILPQENGNRMGVRKLILSGNHDGLPVSIVITPETPVNISVSRYTQKNMWEALHTCDLVDISAKEGYYFLNIDIAQRGVGTATCGPDTLERYRVYPGRYKMRLEEVISG
jgi:beta-galactosidase